MIQKTSKLTPNNLSIYMCMGWANEGYNFAQAMIKSARIIWMNKRIIAFTSKTSSAKPTTTPINPPNKKVINRCKLI